MTSSPSARAQQAVDLLLRLHTYKSAGYGDAWRKRGELLSIFVNMARKYDRLVVALDHDIRSPDERLADTAGDLTIYSGKYLTWLAEREPNAFDNVGYGIRSSDCADSYRPDALEQVLRAIHVEDAGSDVDASWRRLKAAFRPLDYGLVAQAEGGLESISLKAEAKVRMAWEITAASLALLIAISCEAPLDWATWQAEIEGLT